MFNDILIFPPRPPDVNVRVEQKPVTVTDAAKLLRELQQEARNGVLATMPSPANTLNSEVGLTRMPWERRTEAVVNFSLNGKPHTVTVKVDDRDESRAKAQAVFDAVCREIARNVIEPLFTSLAMELKP